MFELKVDDGGEPHLLRFKPLTEVPIGILRRRLDSESQMWATLEWGLSADDLEVLDRLPATELAGIMQQWQEHDEVTTGESSASPPSSTSTARPSKPT